MALRDFHPCDYGFHTTNIRILGASIDGGTSLSGFKDDIQADGGGYRAVDFSNGLARTRETNKAIRALIDEISTTTAVIVRLCAERHFQPVLGRSSLSFSDWNTPVSDDAPDKGANFIASTGAALRATTMQIAGNSEIAITGGELFSILHPTWGWRAYRVGPDGLAGDGAISFATPLREAVTTGTLIEFDNPRCQMRLSAVPDFPTDDGVRTPLSLTFIEDMRKPS